MQLLGIDTGGTFTDFILYKNGEFITHKILSTPEAPQKAILQGLGLLNPDFDNTHFVHGTTVATNALLEGKGARTAFVTNRGFADLLHIGRQTRDQLYSLAPQNSRELVLPQLCFEVDSRVSADGRSIQSVSRQEISNLKDQLKIQQVESVAVCLLFSFLNNRDEVVLGDALQQENFVSLSSDILPEQREYERAIVTWLNSYLGPHTQRYLTDLQTSLGGKHVHVMQSDATTMPARTASNQAVKLLLSGPAGGVVAAATIASTSGQSRLMTLDMGGTSTDVALIDGQVTQTTEGRIAEFPLAVPMLDIHTIGAGGGSVAYADQAGGLHVGPESAGALPGPACYGRGGSHPTVTDANVVLGRLPEKNSWSDGLQLDRDKAALSMQGLAQQLNCSVKDAARGVIELANAHMVQALRVISIHRGFDPADFCLFPFGGAGALHMCEVAEQLGMRNILVPKNAGILSAFGMLHAPIGQLASRTFCKAWDQFDEKGLSDIFMQLEAQAAARLRVVGLEPTRLARWIDLRYQGQSSQITQEWTAFECIAREFTHSHQSQFGYHLPSYPIEVVTVRVWAYQDVETPLPQQAVTTGREATAINYTQIEGYSDPVPVFRRDQLVFQQLIHGPAVILDTSSTQFITENWKAEIHESGHIYLQKTTDCH